MSSKITYKGITTIVQTALFEPVEVIKNPPRKSNKFGTTSIYYEGIYYFPKDIKKSDKRNGKPYEIQAVFYSGKWYQDTFYISEELKNLIEKSI